MIVGSLRLVMAIYPRGDKMIIPLSTGQVVVGDWHQSLSGNPEWMGRCVDLSKAYKQVPIHRKSLRHVILGFNTQEHGWKMFTNCSLPFGASASVFAFNKISRSLWHITGHNGAPDECVLR